ncbi:MAG: hypothetical protein BAJATHORv1_20362 [Candidatus Thorarchaeota archaeon]|nr:MAG: hypothetical protein BAJATHORv1_20362 [Candidatus Thorarchaeota archaeon]
MEQKYPKTRSEDIVEIIHGVEVKDPYRWLEDTSDPEVQEWIAKQMEFSRKVVESYGDQEPIKERLRELSLFDAMSTKPVVIRKTESGYRFFYLFRYKDDPQMRLCYQDGFDGERVELVNPIDISSESSAKIDCYFPSWDGRKVIYGYSLEGREKTTLRVFDIKYNRLLDDEIANLVFASVVWSGDSSGFYYAVNAFRPDEDDTRVGSVLYHKIGTSNNCDITVYSKDDSRFSYIHLLGFESSNWIVLVNDRGKDKDLLVVHTNFISSETISYNLINNASFLRPRVKEKFLFVLYESPSSSRRVARYQIDSSAFDSIPEQCIILEQSESVFDDIAPLDESLLVVELRNAKSVLVRYILDSDKSEVLYGSDTTVHIKSLSTNDDAKFILFSANSYHRPVSQYVCFQTGKIVPFFEPELNLSPHKYTTEQIWFPSFDGKKIPMFILTKRNIDLEKPHPALLTVYGGFGISQYPAYSPLHVVWNELGGIFIYVNTRGGGEFGRKWHEAGMFEKKIDVIHDLISSADWLYENGFSSPEITGIRGSSNGGLIVTAAMGVFPQKFKSVFAINPLTDMIRYIEDSIATYWISEYGTPKQKEAFKWLYSYSPYHNVNLQEEVPHVMFYVAANDARVSPMHSLKQVANLQSNIGVQSNKSKALLWWKDTAGHTGESSMDNWIDFWALELMFHISSIGIELDDSKSIHNGLTREQNKG